MKSKLLFTGSYGKKNTGDDIFCVISAWGAKKYWHIEKVNFLCGRLPFMESDTKIRLTGSQNKYLNFIQTIYKCFLNDYLIFSGGSLFGSGRGRYGKLFKKLQKSKIIKLGAIGVSLGPYRTVKDRYDVQELLKHFSFLCLRDYRSYKDACDMNLPYKPIYAFDLAVFLPEIYGINDKPKNNNHPILGVNVCRWESYENIPSGNEMLREEGIIQALKEITSKIDVEIHLLQINGSENRNDMDSMKKIKEVFQKDKRIKIFPYNDNPRYMWNEIQSCDAILATRLHAGIMSYVAGVPFVQIEYHQKCSDFLDEINMPKKYRVGNTVQLKEKVSNVLFEFLSEQNDIQLTPLSEAKKRSEKNFTISL